MEAVADGETVVIVVEFDFRPLAGREVSQQRIIYASVCWRLLRFAVFWAVISSDVSLRMVGIACSPFMVVLELLVSYHSSMHILCLM